MVQMAPTLPPNCFNCCVGELPTTERKRYGAANLQWMERKKSQRQGQPEEATIGAARTEETGIVKAINRLAMCVVSAECGVWRSVCSGTNASSWLAGCILLVSPHWNAHSFGCIERYGCECWCIIHYERELGSCFACLPLAANARAYLLGRWRKRKERERALGSRQETENE